MSTRRMAGYEDKLSWVLRAPAICSADSWIDKVRLCKRSRVLVRSNSDLTANSRFLVKYRLRTYTATRETKTCYIVCHQNGLQTGQKVEHTGLPTRETKTMIACCHGVSALKSTVASPVPVTPLTQTKRASMYLTSNAPFDAESMPAATIGVNVLTRNVN